MVGFSRLWIEGIMPSGLLVARAHAISPAVLLFRVLKRRHGGFPSVYSWCVSGPSHFTATSFVAQGCISGPARYEASWAALDTEYSHVCPVL
eukprot:2783559-Prymnesium_polylepis.4